MPDPTPTIGGALTAEAQSHLERDLGYRFRDAGLLRLALTHPSVFAQTNEPKPPSPPDNQRMEFLGDAVAQLCVSEALFHRYPDMREGELTRARVSFVRKERLGRAARELRLCDYLSMGEAERRGGVSSQIGVMCDAFEAVTAAIFLDGGLDAARAFLSRALGDYETPDEPASSYNWKSRLQETMQAVGQRAPRYTLLSMTGPPHAPLFTAEARSSDGQILGSGSGSSRKAAEQKAAFAALTLFAPAEDASSREDALATCEA